MHIYTIEQMQALEQASDEAGHSYDAMMARAGRAVADAIGQWLGDDADSHRQVVVLAGPGNNGGDGLVAARALARSGFSVVAYLWKRDEADPLLVEARRVGVAPLRAESHDARQFRHVLSRAGIVVDSLFGTGLSRPIAGKGAEMLAALREVRAAREPRGPLHWLGQAPARPRRPLVVAVDVPSGLHGDSGEVDPATVAADLTVTFAGPKVGMLAPDAAPVLGEWVIADIGIPPDVVAQAPHEATLLAPERAVALLPPRPASGHKGTFGTTLVVGGSVNYVGAPALSALAAGRSGAGLVTLAVPTPIQPLLAATGELLTATWVLLPHDMGVLRPDALDVLRESLEKADALVLGPGLGGEEATRRFVWSLFGLEAGDKPATGTLGFVPRYRASPGGAGGQTLPPTVVDADGLNALAAWEGAWWERVPGPLVLTPHPGEMGRLLGRETGAVQAARLDVAREATQRFGQVVVLKGAFTVVAAPDGRTSVAPYANDALAKAGAGDVLAGMIGALLGQGMEPFDAACLAVVAHGLAGERLRAQRGGQGLLASDLLRELPSVWQSLRASADPRNTRGARA